MNFKCHLFVFVLLSVFCQTQAQSGAMYFSSETGDKFTLFVKGVLQNTIPATEVEALNVSGYLIQCTVAFENPALPTIMGNVEKHTDNAAFIITKDSRGAFVIIPKQTPTSLSNGTTIGGVTITTNGGYVTSVKTGSVEANSHGVKTNNFSFSSNIGVSVAGLPPPPSSADINSMGSHSSGIPKGIYYFEAEGTDSFYLTFNGVKVNRIPQTKVVVHGVTGLNMNAEVAFTDPSSPPISKKQMRQGRDVYYGIERNKKGEHVIKIRNLVGDLSSPGPYDPEPPYTQPQIPVSTFTITSAQVTKTTTGEVAVPAPSANVSIAAKAPTPPVTTAKVTTPSAVVNIPDKKPTASVTVPVVAPPAKPKKASIPTPASNSVLKGEVQGNKIVLSDGRQFTMVTYAGESLAPHIKSSTLQGAKFYISYNDGFDTYTGSFPLDYTIPEKEKFGEVLTLTVDEGGPDKTWSIKLPNSKWHWVNIEI